MLPSKSVMPDVPGAKGGAAWALGLVGARGFF